MGFFQGLITGLTGDSSIYDNSESDGNGVSDFIGGFLGGALSSFFNQSESWTDWIDSFQNEVNADVVYFEVEHKIFHDECVLNAVILDEDGEVMASNSWELPYEDEIKKLHKQMFKIHNGRDYSQLLGWVMSFNNTHNVSHTYSEVKHTPGDQNATVDVCIVDKNNNIIAVETFNGPYEELKELHKDCSYFPIGINDNQSSENFISGYVSKQGNSSTFTFENPCGWSIENGKGVITAKRIQLDSNEHSGSLKICLWYCNSTYEGGSLDGYCMGESIFCNEGLEVGYGFPDFSQNFDIIGNPPTGDYYSTVTVNELHADGNWYIVGWVNFDGTSHWNHE